MGQAHPVHVKDQIIGGICGQSGVLMAAEFTAKQGQYLAFIYHYTKVNQRPPAQTDIQCFFGVTPPSVHTMLLTLERKGLLARTPGRARSIEVLVERDELPHLD